MTLGPTNRGRPDGGSGAVPQDGKIKKKGRGHEKPRSTALVIAAATGAGATATNAHGLRGVIAAHALCTPIVATTPWSVARSLASRNTSASGTSSLPRTAPHLVADPARKGSTTVRWPWLNGTSGISHPRGPEGCHHRRLLLRW
jgi:hypothetical protein